MRRVQQKGFTLVEILVVVSIIILMMSYMLVSFAKVRLAARDTRRLANLKTLSNALELYYAKYAVYPCGSVTTVNGLTQTDGDWLHANTAADSFLDSIPISSVICTSPPTTGLVTEGLIPSGMQDPTAGNSYIYEVSNDRQFYILYADLEDAANLTKMTNDGGLSACYYEVGNGIGRISPYWICQ